MKSLSGSHPEVVDLSDYRLVDSSDAIRDVASAFTANSAFRVGGAALAVLAAPVVGIVSNYTEAFAQEGSSDVVLENLGDTTVAVRFEAKNKMPYTSVTLVDSNLVTDIVIASDDIPSDVTLVKADGSRVKLEPVLALKPSFNPANLTAEERALAESMGINVEKEELLRQRVFLNVSVAKGDKIITTFIDDPSDGEFDGDNVGATYRFKARAAAGYVNEDKSEAAAKKVTLPAVDGVVRVQEVDAFCTALKGGNICPDVRQTVRFEGEQYVGEMSFENFPNGAELSGARVVCDDICEWIGIVHEDGTFTQLETAYFSPNFDYKSLAKEQQDYLRSIGINVENSELLGQHTLDVTKFKKGDKLAVVLKDDKNLGVNVGLLITGNVTPIE